MPAEIVACVLGVLALILAGVMDAVGVMGIAGAVRFTNCRLCSRWTLASEHSDAMCLRCRHHEHAHDHAFMGRIHVPRLHLGH